MYTNSHNVGYVSFAIPATGAMESAENGYIATPRCDFDKTCFVCSRVSLVGLSSGHRPIRNPTTLRNLAEIYAINIERLYYNWGDK